MLLYARLTRKSVQDMESEDELKISLEYRDNRCGIHIRFGLAGRTYFSLWNFQSILLRSNIAAGKSCEISAKCSRLQAKYLKTYLGTPSRKSRNKAKSRKDFLAMRLDDKCLGINLLTHSETYINVGKQITRASYFSQKPNVNFGCRCLELTA